MFICLALSRDLRMCHCDQGTSRIFGPKAISPAVQVNGRMVHFYLYQFSQLNDLYFLKESD